MTIKSLINISAIYATANLLQRGLNFLLIPIYARYFTKGEFGAMDIVCQTVAILAMVTSLGLPQGLVRGFYLDKPSEEDRRKLLGALFIFLSPVLVVISIVMLLIADPLTDLLFKEEGQNLWLQLTVAFYISASLQGLTMEYLKTRQKAMKFAFWSLICFLVVAAGNILFVVVLEYGLSGMIIANIIGFSVTAVFLFPEFFRNMRLNVEFKRLRPLFAFGLPMLPALFSRKILEISDRYILPQYHGLEELGSYVMGAKVVSIVDAFVLVPFLFAWMPFFYSQAENPEAPRIFARVTHLVIMLLTVIFLSIEICSDWLISFLGGGQYDEATSVVTILLIAVVFNGIQYSISPGIHLRKKLIQETGLMMAAAALNLGLNFLLIPPHGRDGAAVATLIAYGFYLVSTFMLSQRHFPVCYPYPRIIKIVVLAALSYLGIRCLESLALRMGILACFLACGPILDLWIHENLAERLSDLKSKWWRRSG